MAVEFTAYGGAFGVAVGAWLKWQLMGDTSAAGKGYVAGPNGRICADSKWQTRHARFRERLFHGGIVVM